MGIFSGGLCPAVEDERSADNNNNETEENNVKSNALDSHTNYLISN